MIGVQRSACISDARATRQIPDTELQRIDVPTALVWGSHDRIAPLRYAQTTSSQLGWPLTAIDGAAHLPHIEQPSAFIEALAGGTGGA